MNYYLFNHILRKLTTVILPEKITYIPQGFFRECSSLNNIVIPNGVSSIDNGAFECCKGLTNITILDTLEYIYGLAFSNSGLTSIIIPDNVKEIDNYAFTFCDQLTSITLGKGIEYLGTDIFSNGINLICIIYKGLTVPDSSTDLLGKTVYVSKEYLEQSNTFMGASLVELQEEKMYLVSGDECVACYINKGYFENDGKCVKCEEGEYFNTETNKCIEKDSNEQHSNGQDSNKQSSGTTSNGVVMTEDALVKDEEISTSGTSNKKGLSTGTLVGIIMNLLLEEFLLL